MALSQEFVEAVNQNKLTLVRIMLKDSLLLDSSFSKFDEMFGYAKDKMDLLIDQHDGELFKPTNEWSEDYLNKEMVSVVSNFSLERIELLKNIVRYLSKDTIRSNDKTVSDLQDKEKPTHNNGVNKDADSTKDLGRGLAVVGAGALVVGIAISNVPVVVPILGGIAFGTGAYLMKKGDK